MTVAGLAVGARPPGATPVTLPVRRARSAGLLGLVRKDAWLTLAVDAAASMERSASVVAAATTDARPVYGVTTGLGAMADVPAAEPERTQLEYIVNYAVGVGESLPAEVVRLALLLRANTLALGMSGVRPLVVRSQIALFNSGCVPVVPRFGSVGASGDLVPLAHLMLPLLGRGRVCMPDGKIVDGESALRSLGLVRLELETKEGVSLVNAHAFSLALAISVLDGVKRLARWADAAASLSLLALSGHRESFAAEFARAGWSSGADAVARRVRGWIVGCGPFGHFAAFGPNDPYSFRCVPQIHGAVIDVVDDCEAVLDRECNAASDNPLVLGDRIVSGGMFHGEGIAMRVDAMRAGLLALAEASTQRQQWLGDRSLRPRANRGAGLRSVSAAATGAVAASRTTPLNVLAGSQLGRLRTLALPATMTSVSLEYGLQDVVSMAMTSGLMALDALDGLAVVLACEVVTAAIRVRERSRRTGPRLSDLMAWVSPAAADGSLQQDVLRVQARMMAP